MHAGLVHSSGRPAMAFTSNASREPSRFEYQLALQEPAQCTGANNGTARKQRLDADTQWSNAHKRSLAVVRMMLPTLCAERMLSMYTCTCQTSWLVSSHETRNIT